MAIGVINVGSMGAKTAALLRQCGAALGALQTGVSCTAEAISIDGKESELYLAAVRRLPREDLDAEAIGVH